MDENTLKGDLGEDFVNQLAFKSFLKYWCYPNVRDEKGDKKEICDLLVLFRDTCIIITVKNYKFDGNHERYFRNTVDKALRQLNGAERKLFKFPREIVIKHPDRTEETFDRNKYKNVFRIIVNLGEGLEFYHPGLTNSNGDFITVFDRDTFQILLTELDTIADLTDYLSKRQKLFEAQKSLLLQGEEKDLIALFIRHRRDFPKEFKRDEYHMMILDVEGEWDKFITEEEKRRNAKKKEDKVSYFIDELTERELNKLPQGHLLSQELLVLNRFARRTLAKLFIDFYSLHEGRLKLATGHRYVELEDIGFVFFYYSPDLMVNDFADHALQTAVMGYSVYTNYKMKKMYGIGTTHHLEQFKFMFLEVNEPFDPTTLSQLDIAIKEFGWFKNIKYTPFTEKEIPDID
jgi:hypothetical protein